MEEKDDDRPQSSDHFSIRWKNLIYRLERPLIDVLIDKILGKNDVKSKTVIHGVSGEFKSGELTALMGPSGAGKSTLLECITGKRLIGRSGIIGLTGNRKVSVAFIPQQDHFFDLFTVREALIFASKLKNSAIKESDDLEAVSSEEPGERIVLRNVKKFHEQIVNSLLAQLSLQVCAETRISSLSGGQMKRFSIAQELVARPDILILDEPTSGLDSASCVQTVELLHHLTQQSPPIAIVATIHQPSAKVFNLFHKVYILSKIGKFIYDRSPRRIHEWLENFNMKCPEFFNPADFIIEIASGDYGQECIKSMIAEIDAEEDTGNDANVNLLEQHIFSPKFHRLYAIMIFSQRLFIYFAREIMLLFFRIFSVIFVASLLAILFADIGHIGGCPPAQIDKINVENYADFDRQIRKEYEQAENNLGFLFFITLFFQFYGILCGVIGIIIKMKTVAKEVANGWYDTFSYFTAFTIADIPVQLLCCIIFIIMTYYFTGQPLQLSRFAKFALTLYVLINVTQTHGIIVGAIFSPNLTAAVFVGPLTTVPFILFSGYLIFYVNIPSYLKIFADISYIRYAFECMVMAIYGDLRCGEGIGAKMELAQQRITYFIYTVFSYVLDHNEYDYEDVRAESLETMRNDAKNITSVFLNAVDASFEDYVKANDEMESIVLTTFQLHNYTFAFKIFGLTAILISYRIIAYLLVKRNVLATH
ncbi:ATP-binding cassette sub-family G member 1-like protein [Dinothrombium tinctorium]|uniref:ATP-binding cassette sub-family G member 1-like protein n=1 Tax=Dinothrombium tinctorium TaxID=1965070 RepID=A0A3S3NHZ5_9ACAR|nr:ATP-binding cassette sub-family G member 1-like protein [Dinothrombium tinctorium]RWS03059.1 ATP-binding cassette sub-family G member 1-like protein [Dinothrombium tinctorium]RWS04892.1 ATP-binding cassette sub-family G member 1-like protein [Dinothrombium tinctorium]